MGRSKSSPSQENEAEEDVMGASVMIDVLRDTAVRKLQDWMHEYDGPSKEFPASRETLGGSLRGWGRIQFLSITTLRLTESALTRSPGPALASAAGSLAPCPTSRVP